MPLAEVLQWAGVHGKSGVLEIERDKLVTRIRFQDGRIVGCSSTDPSSLLGHFLISRGKITEETLKYGLQQQKETGASLPEVLVEIGVLPKDELLALVRAKAEESIYRLFDWENGFFRFRTDAPSDRHKVDIDLSVEETILEGERHKDDLRRFRDVFDSHSIVISRSEKPLPAGPGVGALGLRLLELCADDRALAEIVLRAHASEYEVLKTLHEFYQDGYIEIAGRESVGQDPWPVIDDDGTPFLGDQQQATAHSPEAETPALFVEDEEGADSVGVQLVDPYGLVRIVSEKFENGDEEGAIAVLDACYRTRYHDDFLKHLLDKAEEAYLSKIQVEFLQLDKIPVRTGVPESIPAAELNPTESTLMGLIDGVTSIQSILWIVPLHEIQVLRGLEGLRTRGLIRLDDAPVAAAGKPGRRDAKKPLASD